MRNELMADQAQRDRNIRQHWEIFSAIEARDADRAATAATAHYTEARDVRLRA